MVAVRPGPNFSVADVHNGWTKALRQLGVQLVEYQLDERLTFYSNAHLQDDDGWVRAFDEQAAVRLAANGLKAALYDYWPDVVLVTSAFFIPPDFYPVMRARGHKLVALFTESPYEDDRQLERAHFYDVILLNDPTNIEQYRAINRHTYYVPHAYDPDTHSPGPADPDLACDVCFVGTGYPSRHSLLRDVDWAPHSLRLAGNWQAWDDDPWVLERMVHPIDRCCDNIDAVRLYRSARASVNVYRKEASADADGWAMGPREVELAACGTFFFREQRAEGDQLLPMLPTFGTAAELTELVQWWLAHDDAREAAARQAREAIADRTFATNARHLLARLQ